MYYKSTLLTIIIGILNFAMSYSQSELKLVKKKNDDYIHFSIADKVPYENNCSEIKNEKERIACLEKSLRDQILSLIKKKHDYNGEMYVWFTVDKKGKIIDIITKGYPSSTEFENDIKIAITKLKVTKSSYRNRKANIRCYTRVYPESFE